MEPTHTKPVTPRYTAGWLARCAAAALLLGAAACSSGSITTEDAKLTDCANDGTQRVKVEVHNTSSDVGDFVVDVVRNNADTGKRRDVVSVRVEAVRPGETASGYAFGEMFGGAGYTCEIIDVRPAEDPF